MITMAMKTAREVRTTAVCVRARGAMHGNATFLLVRARKAHTRRLYRCGCCRTMETRYVRIQFLPTVCVGLSCERLYTHADEHTRTYTSHLHTCSVWPRWIRHVATSHVCNVH